MSVTETVAGTGANFSDLTQQVDRTVGQKAQTDVAVKELQDKIQYDQEVIRAAKDFRVQEFQPLPRIPIAVPKLLRERALGALDWRAALGSKAPAGGRLAFQWVPAPNDPLLPFGRLDWTPECGPPDC